MTQVVCKVVCERQQRVCVWGGGLADPTQGLQPGAWTPLQMWHTSPLLRRLSAACVFFPIISASEACAAYTFLPKLQMREAHLLMHVYF